uniref:Uncharacterized protein n=1 Tax=Rhizophora mucronata TaxID=61149 RepID=A0A2P2PAP2_RHIMU
MPERCVPCLREASKFKSYLNKN